MKKQFAAATMMFAVAIAVAAQCGQPAKNAQRRHEDYDVAEMFKMHYNPVAKEFHTGAQPTVEILKEFKDKGFKTVINLREPDEHNAAEEIAAAKKLGLRYFNIPVAYRSPKSSQADEFLKLTDDPANRPVLIHCTINIRAGAFWMIRRMAREGWTFEAALAEAQRGVEIAPHYQKFVRDYVAQLPKKQGP